MTASKQKVLILGGTRFFGYHIARALIVDGHDVTVFSRGRSNLFPEGATHIAGDRGIVHQFKKTFADRQYDVVIDMIAYQEIDSRTAVETFEGSIGHFVHVSTASVYSVLEELPAPVKEEHFNGKVRKPNKMSKGFEYGMGKRRCEETLWEAHARSGFPVTTLRLPIVLGEGDYTQRAQSYLLRIMDGEPLILPSGGLNPMSFVYQGDVVEFVISHLGDEKVIGEAFNLAQDEIPTVRSFVEHAARLTGRDPELIDIPIALLKRVDYDFAGSPFSSKRAFIISNLKARSAGFEPTPMEEWLERTVRHLTAQGPSEVPPEYENRDQELEIIDAWRQTSAAFSARLAREATVE